MKSLADLYYKQGFYEESLNYLDNMVFIDSLYTEQEIDLYKTEIREKLAKKSYESAENIYLSSGETELAKRDGEE